MDGALWVDKVQGTGAGAGAGAGAVAVADDLQAAYPAVVAKFMLACERESLGRWERIRTHGAIE